MRNVAFIALGFLILILQAAVSSLVPMRWLAPNLLLPVVIYLGVSHDIGIVRGAALSFVLGYLLDSFCGSPMGLQTFVMVATFMAARGAGLKFFLRGPLFQVGLTFGVGVGAGATVLALRAIFEPPSPFPVDEVWPTVVSLVVPALVTAIFSPIVFAVARRIDSALTRPREEGASPA